VSEPHTFEVGELAILIFSRIHPEYDGEDVEVIAPLADRLARRTPGDSGSIILGYLVRVINSDTLHVEPFQLKKKPPYDQRLGTTWDRCAWRPKRLTVPAIAIYDGEEI
jgi:hypothetical protein